MNMDWDKGFFFSQHSLNIFKQCPIRFQKRYMDGLFWKNALNDVKDDQMERGRFFHLLAERHFSGIPLHMEFFEEYGELNEWMDLLKKSVSKRNEEQYYPEYQIKVHEGSVALQAKYDLVVKKDDGSILIYDWKTEKKPFDRKRAAEAIQTRVYRYVMAKGGRLFNEAGVAPEDITMVYWQPSRPREPLILPYSTLQYQEDEQNLKRMIEGIRSFNYEQYDKSLSRQYCQYCEYNYFCNDDRVEYNKIFPKEEILLEDWDEIPEISF